MASLSRGLWHPASPRLLFNPRPILADLLSPSRPRFFSSSICRFKAQPKATPKPAAKPAAKPARAASPHPKFQPQGIQQPVTQGPSGYALVKSLAARNTPTVLYEAPSSFWFTFGCWTSGISMLAWTALTGPQVVFQPEGVPQFVSWTYGVSYVLFGALGFFLLKKTFNIVRTVRAIPVHPPATTQSSTAGAPSMRLHYQAPQLNLELTVNSALPFLKPRIVTVPLDKVSLRSRFSLPDEYVPELRRERRKRSEEKKQKELMKKDMDRLLTMPFRRMGRAFLGLFRGVRSAWTDMGWGFINIDKKSYKVNVVNGFAHDGFRTLEKLVPVKAK